VSVVDREGPEVSCSEWHADGTAGENDRASHLVAKHHLDRWARPVQDDTSLVGKAPARDSGPAGSSATAQ
jgi:hypothetical protein